MLNTTNYQRMQIKTTMRYQHTLIRMATTKKSTNNKFWKGYGEKGTFLHCWWESKMIQLLWRTVWRVLKKLKTELPHDPAILLLGIYPEKTIIQKDKCTPMFTATLLQHLRHESNLNSKRGVNKDVVQINGVLLSHKEE